MANTNSSAWNLSSRSAVDDPSSSYFLHHSDNPGLVLVSQPLTGDNFVSWSRAMRIALSVKNKLGFIDGSIPKPADSETNLLSAWVRNNNNVISWLLNSVSKDISASILFAESAEDIWNDLKDRFQQSNGPRIFQIRKDLINLRQGQDSVSVYFTKIKALWEELNHFRPMCSCGKCGCNGVKNLEAYIQMDYTMTFLMGLNESFTHIRSQVLLLDPLPPISRVFSLVVQEERQRAIGNQSSMNAPNPNMAFAFKNDQNQSQFNNRPPPRFSKGRPFCTHCNILGHTVETCYKIHGHPPGLKAKNKQENKGHAACVHQETDQICHSETLTNNVGTTSNVVQNFDKNQVEQLMAMMIQQLYTSEKKVNEHEGDNPSVNQVGIQTWHSRLGHPSMQVLQILKTHFHFGNADVHDDAPCSVCPIAKQRRLPFVHLNNKSYNAFDLIHCDVWGPYHVPTVNKQRYFLTLVDDCTRFTWIFLMQHKSEASSVVSRFCNMIETQFSKRIKAFRTDNAMELAFTELFQTKGILHQFSCVETPQQNSVVERKHQHLLNVARALFFQSSIPLGLWSECIMTATYLVNRVPSPSTQNKSPYELLYHKKVDYTHLRVFGCLAFASTLAAHRDKFMSRARLCVFL
ncbi:uncharacterized protein LOC142519815 [Primulina tabacum]|uniref:uncharacterized protein LOC142519815 n=1 Tax=Primulina tabacum TaxID=48773 RepID=UPI003F595B70